MGRAAWCVAAVAIGLAARGGGQDLAPAYRSSPCARAARIDGVQAPGEWDGAARTAFQMAMVTGRGAPAAPRRAELLLMNSGRTLYAALRIPDTARDASTNPLVIDAATLAFCRGAELREGDDRRVVAPTLWADKRFLAPGKDADDAHRDGAAAMRWSRTAAGGEYFVEWQIPLSSGDPNDISVKPGGRIRFNLAYADRLSPGLADTELGGLFGPDTDHVKGWGWLVLADTDVSEAPPAAPEWLARIVPNTGAPGRLANRLRRVDAVEAPVGEQTGGILEVELSFPGVTGRDETGQARIFLPPSVRTDPTRRVPMILNAGYPIDDGFATDLMSKGYAVCTPHNHPLNPLGRGANLDTAILHAVRQLPCIDPGQLSIQGGSAGGWMTLMLTADAFPLVWSIPDVPPIHWGYNAGYIAGSAELAGPAEPGGKPRLPVLLQVSAITDQASKVFGMPYESEDFLALSPLAHLETITVPTLATFSTADMLVPVDQVGASLVRRRNPALYPAGFTTAMTDRYPGVKGSRTLIEALPPNRRQLTVLNPPGPRTPLVLDGPPAGPSMPMKLPFSSVRLWSINVIDEGPTEPAVGHFKYAWSVDHEKFRAWAQARGVVADQLTGPKLERLMKRLKGEPWRTFHVQPGGEGPIVAGNALDYPEAERADVLTGLAAFAADDARAVRLGQLYTRLPGRLKELGGRLGDGTPAGIRRALEAARVAK